MGPPARTGTSTSWEDARARAADVAALPVRRVLVADAAGEVLAERVWARSPLPPADCSAMDGWAVRGPGPWRVLGRTLAGEAPGAGLPGGVLPDGGAVEVATGSAVPGGCEGVLPAEDGVLLGAELTGPAPGGRHVRRRGEEVPAWTALLDSGTRLSPAAAGLAAATGSDVLAVLPRPAVEVLLTGDELLTAGVPVPGRIRDALGPLVPPTLRAAGADPAPPRHVGDRAGALAAALGAVSVPVCVVTGSTAAGPADALRAVLADLGADLVVDGVACRPGHPMLLAVLPGGCRVVGLPGNPLAALAGLVTLAVPLLAALRGTAVPAPDRVRCAAELPASGAATRLVPVRRHAGVAVPTGHDGSAMLRGAAGADGFAVVPPDAHVAAGGLVDVVDLPGAAAPAT